MKTFVRCASHRAADKLRSLMGKRLQCYYSWKRWCTGGWFLIPDDKVPEATKIKGITVARQHDDLHPCINWCNHKAAGCRIELEKIRNTPLL